MNFYKNIFALIIFSIILFSACTAESEKNTTDNSIEVILANDEIVITSKQFSSSGMKLGKITRKTFSERIQTTGMIDVPPEYKAAVTVFYGGMVKDVHLLVGQIVKKGETLFALENPEYVEMQQDYLNAKNKLKYLKAEYERVIELLENNIASQKKYLKAESDYYTVLSNFNALGKKLQLLNINTNNLDYNSISTSTTIKAPMDGYITEVNITKGEYLSSNEVSIAIVNTEHMHLELNIFEKDIAKIKKGQTIKFTLPDNNIDAFEGEVFLIGKTVYSDDRTINIHGHLRNETQELNFMPGMYIEAEILVNEIEQPAIPNDAIVNVDENNFILIKKYFGNDEYTFLQREVKVGKTNDGYTEILNANEFNNNEIVIKGAFNLIQ
ncbi:MAG: efflux RND transporter periplasmic adaptor subunit [Melioribacteraceae bacterium]|nr:efflux RND transporter periplasmic adaptor subunit [Melioribacteraceae bacterium]